jgi:hypothetical protein
MIRVSIKKCPTCGSRDLQKLCKDWKSNTPGGKYTVPLLEYYKCPDCKEELYDKEAMRKIEAASPTYKKISRRKIAA